MLYLSPAYQTPFEVSFIWCFPKPVDIFSITSHQAKLHVVYNRETLSRTLRYLFYLFFYQSRICIKPLSNNSIPGGGGSPYTRHTTGVPRYRVSSRHFAYFFSDLPYKRVKFFALVRLIKGWGLESWNNTPVYKNEWRTPPPQGIPFGFGTFVLWEPS